MQHPEPFTSASQPLSYRLLSEFVSAVSQARGKMPEDQEQRSSLAPQMISLWVPGAVCLPPAHQGASRRACGNEKERGTRGVGPV